MSQVGTLARRHFEPLLLSAQVLIDLGVVIGACLLAYHARDYVGWRSPIELETQWQLFYLTGAVCLVCFHAFGMYSPIKSLLNIEEFKSIAKSSVVAFLVLNALLFFLRRTDIRAEGPFWSYVVKLHQMVDLNGNPERFSRVEMILSFGFILTLTMLSRFTSFKVIQWLHRRGIGNRNVLIIGTGQTGRRLQKKFVLVPTLGLNLVGFVGDDKDQIGAAIAHTRVLGTIDELEFLVKKHKISEVFVAIPEASEERVLEVAEVLDRAGIVYHIVPRFYHLMSHLLRIETLDSIPLITRMERRPSVVYAALKRSLDLIIALIVVVIGAPFFLIPALLIKRESPGPVFFLQTRMGRDGKPFRMIKFRTMHVHLSGDAPKPRSHADPRVTRIGRWLRRYSFDELPQVLNVLRGEMSIVGPRPEMPFIVENYGPLERERLLVKPGLTGLWQISYARSEAIHENLEYDIYYIEHQSILLDLVIIALTGFAVVKGTGAY